MKTLPSHPPHTHTPPTHHTPSGGDPHLTHCLCCRHVRLHMRRWRFFSNFSGWRHNEISNLSFSLMSFSRCNVTYTSSTLNTFRTFWPQGGSDTSINDIQKYTYYYKQTKTATTKPADSCVGNRPEALGKKMSLCVCVFF